MNDIIEKLDEKISSLRADIIEIRVKKDRLIEQKQIQINMLANIVFELANNIAESEVE